MLDLRSLQENDLTNGKGGASAIHYEQLSALWELGHEIHLWHYCYRRREKIQSLLSRTGPWDEIQSKCKSVT